MTDSGRDRPSVLVGGTGMVRLPPGTGGAVEAYIHDILAMFSDTPENYGPAAVRAVSDWVPGYEFRDRCLPVRSPIDRYPLPPYLSALAHWVGGTLTTRAIEKEVRRHPPDVLHLNEEVTIRLCEGMDLAKVVTIHGPAEYLLRLARSRGWLGDEPRSDGTLNTLLRRIDWELVWEALGSYDQVIVLTSFAKETLARLGIPSTLIPLPVDTGRYHPLPDPPAATPRTVLFVGRLEKRKDPTLLVEALTKLPSDVRLVLVGRGPEEPAVRGLASRLGLEGRVTLLTECSSDRLTELYRSSGVFVLPSRIEAYGKVVNEALASGLPVVVAKSRIYDGLFEAGVVSWFDNVDECAEAVGRLLDQTELRQERSSRSREYAEQKLSYASIRGQLSRVYGAPSPS